LILFCAWLFAGCRIPGGEEGEKVVIYTPFPEITSKQLKHAFEARTGIRVVQVNDGTTRLQGRLRAERSRPVADVWYGGGGIVPFIAAAEDGLLESYVPAGYQEMPQERGNLVLRDRDFRWTGMCIIALGYAYNPKVLPPGDVPQTWDDLTDPKYRGKIEMWDPGVSGTAMLFLGSSLQRFINRGDGEEAGWDYLKGYWQNLKGYTVEGKPAFNVARGSVGIGIHFEHQVLDFMEEQTGGGPGGSDNIRWYLPPDSPVSVDPIALIKNGPNRENGKRFIDFVMSEEGQRIVNRFFFSVDPKLPPPGGMADLSIEILTGKAQKLDTEWMAKNHDRIRKRWQNEIEQIPKDE
jgi:iron(III) transport system substrate-binding protein